MTHFPILLNSACVGPILHELEANSDLWNEKAERREGDSSPHREAPDIWVRYNDHNKFGPNFNDEHIPVWYPAWERLPALRPLIFGLMQIFEGEMLGGVLITKVPAGKKIYPHIDAGWHVDYYEKFYVQLTGATGCDFCCEYGNEVERFTPMAGDVYHFDNRKTHWVDNNSDVDRITLIVCIRTDVFRRQKCS